MARIRTIKPDFFASEDVAELPLRTRLTWIGLWTQCDDHGRWKDNPKLVKAAIWPLDDISLKDIESDLNTLADRRRIVRYENGDGRYLAVVSWHVHQAINRPSRAKHPAPPEPVNPLDSDEAGYCVECATGKGPGAVTSESMNTHGGLTEDSRQERIGKDQGKEGTRARARQLPGSWQPNEQHRGYAAQQALDIDAEVAQFRDYHAAKGSTMKDWDAAFRTWLRNAVKFRRDRPAKAPPDLPHVDELPKPPNGLTDAEYVAWAHEQKRLREAGQ